jgi:glycogen operon protein
MIDEYWVDPNNKSLIVKFASPFKNEPSILVLFNASHVEVKAKMPCTDAYSWKAIINTTPDAVVINGENEKILAPRSVYVYEGNALTNLP